MRMTKSLLATVLIGCWAATPVAGQTKVGETSVMVRVLARDAKLLGDAVGGARVTITEVRTGEVLAAGVTSGGTGDTEAIMNRRRTKGAGVFDSPGASGWLAEFELRQPTLVLITAEGPLAYPEAGARASKTLLLAPGAKIGGDGIVLELNGLIVEVLEPPSPGEGSRATEGSLAPVRARVRMLCSCPTQPGGLWSVERVSARLLDEGQVVAGSELEFSGETSVYTGAVRAPGPGRYTLEILASDPATGNFGRARAILEIPADGGDFLGTAVPAGT
jgi:hypothetical protein